MEVMMKTLLVTGPPQQTVASGCETFAFQVPCGQSVSLVQIICDVCIVK